MNAYHRRINGLLTIAILGVAAVTSLFACASQGPPPPPGSRPGSGSAAVTASPDVRSPHGTVPKETGAEPPTPQDAGSVQGDPQTSLPLAAGAGTDTET